CDFTPCPRPGVRQHEENDLQNSIKGENPDPNPEVFALMQTRNRNRAGLQQISKDLGGDSDEERRSERSEGEDQTPGATPAPFFDEADSTDEKDGAQDAEHDRDENQRNDDAVRSP